MPPSQAQHLRNKYNRAQSPHSRDLIRKEIHAAYLQSRSKAYIPKPAPQTYTFRWHDLVILAVATLVIVAGICRAITSVAGHLSTEWLIVAIVGAVLVVGVGTKIFRKEGWLRRKT